MAKTKNATTAEIEAYEKVRDLIKERVVAALPPERRSTKTNLFRACMAQEQPGKHWLLLEHGESGRLTLFKGEPVAIDGCVDGLNIYPRTSPLVRFMMELALITHDEAKAFIDEAWKRGRESDDVSELATLRIKAAHLGYALTPLIE